MLQQDLSRFRLFDSFREMDRLHHQLSRLFDGSNSLGSWRMGHEYPPVNVWTNEEQAVITAELPGFTVDDIDISVVNHTVTLRGERKNEELQSGELVHRQERTYGQFSRSIQLPFRVDPDGVQATFKLGVLNITLPRAESDKPRKITVSA